MARIHVCDMCKEVIQYEYYTVQIGDSGGEGTFSYEVCERCSKKLLTNFNKKAVQLEITC